MGTLCAPNYANIFMEKFEKKNNMLLLPWTICDILLIHFIFFYFLMTLIFFLTVADSYNARINSYDARIDIYNCL